MTGTTQSQHTANDMTVAIDWAALGKMSVTLKATVSTQDEVTSHLLSQEETRHIVRTAKDYTDYARVYHDMIS